MYRGTFEPTSAEPLSCLRAHPLLKDFSDPTKARKKPPVNTPMTTDIITLWSWHSEPVHRQSRRYRATLAFIWSHVSCHLPNALYSLWSPVTAEKYIIGEMFPYVQQLVANFIFLLLDTIGRSHSVEVGDTMSMFTVYAINTRRGSPHTNHPSTKFCGRVVFTLSCFETNQPRNKQTDKNVTSLVQVTIDSIKQIAPSQPEETHQALIMCLLCESDSSQISRWTEV